MDTETEAAMDSEAQRIAKGLIDEALQDRRREFSEDVGRLIRDVTAQHQLGSGRFHLMLQQRYSAEIQLRAQIAWKVLHRVLTTVPIPVDPELADTLKSLLAGPIEREAAQMRSELEMQLGRFNARQLARKQTEEMTSGAALRRIGLEVDLYLRSRQEAPAGVQTTVEHHYHAPVGAVQSGAGSTATVTQIVSGSGTQELREALERLGADLSSFDGSQPNVSEISELVEVAKQELSVDEPRRLPILGALQGIAAGVQVIPGLRASWEGVRVAARGLGLPIP